MLKLLEKAKVSTTNAQTYFDLLLQDVDEWMKGLPDTEPPRLPDPWISGGGEGGVGRRVYQEAKRQLGQYLTARTVEQIDKLTKALGFEKGYEWWMEWSKDRFALLAEDITKWKRSCPGSPRVPKARENEGRVGKCLYTLSLKVKKSEEFRRQNAESLKRLAEALGYTRDHQWWNEYAQIKIIPDEVKNDVEILKGFFHRWQSKKEHRFCFPHLQDSVETTGKEQQQYWVEEIHIGHQLNLDAQKIVQEKDATPELNDSRRGRLRACLTCLNTDFQWSVEDFAKRIYRSHRDIDQLKLPECEDEIVEIFKRWRQWKMDKDIQRDWPRFREIFKDGKEYGLGFYLNQKFKDAKSEGKRNSLKKRTNAIEFLKRIGKALQLEDEEWWKDVQPVEERGPKKRKSRG
jgi:hypothetical protein